VCGLAPTYETLVIARAVTGLFGGVVGAAVMAIIGDVFADYRRGTAMGAVMSSFAVASIVGVPLGLMLAENFGTGAPFVALAIVSALVWVGTFFVMPSFRGHLAKGHPPASMWGLAAEPNHLLAFSFTVFLVLGSFRVVPYLADSLVANAGQKMSNMKYVYLVAGGFTLFSTNLVGRLADRYGKLRVFRITGTAAIATILIMTNLPPVALWVDPGHNVTHGGDVGPNGARDGAGDRERGAAGARRLPELECRGAIGGNGPGQRDRGPPDRSNRRRPARRLSRRRPDRGRLGAGELAARWGAALGRDGCRARPGEGGGGGCGGRRMSQIASTQIRRAAVFTRFRGPNSYNDS